MSSRLAALGLGLVLLTAGCLSGTPVSGVTSDTTNASTSMQTTTVSDSRDETRLIEKSLPEPPENLTRDTVVRFVESYERAYEWNRQLTNNTTELTINPTRVMILNATETGYVVHLEVGFSKTAVRDGSKVAGSGFYTTNYFVNETVVMRAQTGGQVRPGPDPRNGTIIEGA